MRRSQRRYLDSYMGTTQKSPQPHGEGKGGIMEEVLRKIVYFFIFFYDL